jgi:hypothetical protein
LTNDQRAVGDLLLDLGELLAVTFGGSFLLGAHGFTVLIA